MDEKIPPEFGASFYLGPGADLYYAAHERMWHTETICAAWNGEHTSGQRKNSDGSIYGFATTKTFIDEAIKRSMYILMGQRVRPLRLVSVSLCPYTVGRDTYIAVTVIAEEYPRFQRRYASWKRK